jgi:hypothetical protein
MADALLAAQVTNATEHNICLKTVKATKVLAPNLSLPYQIENDQTTSKLQMTAS